MTVTMTPREIADAKKRTCSRCSRGQHELCTLAMCAHYLCTTDEDELSPVDPPVPAAPAPARVLLLVWEDPPPKRGSGGTKKIRPSAGQAALLREHPGRFARIDTFAGRGSAQSNASKLNRGSLATPPGRWEFQGGSLPQGGSGLWCRFLGEAE